MRSGVRGQTGRGQGRANGSGALRGHMSKSLGSGVRGQTRAQGSQGQTGWAVPKWAWLNAARGRGQRKWAKAGSPGRHLGRTQRYRKARWEPPCGPGRVPPQGILGPSLHHCNPGIVSSPPPPTSPRPPSTTPHPGSRTAAFCSPQSPRLPARPPTRKWPLRRNYSPPPNTARKGKGSETGRSYEAAAGLAEAQRGTHSPVPPPPDHPRWAPPFFAARLGRGEVTSYRRAVWGGKSAPRRTAHAQFIRCPFSGGFTHAQSLCRRAAHAQAEIALWGVSMRMRRFHGDRVF